MGKFSCDSCGKSYTWKPQFAGKKVKCKCGNVMTAPAAEPSAEQEPDMDALFALADEGQQAAVAAPPTIRCPSCKTQMEPGATFCAQCGFDLKSGRRIPPSAGKGSKKSAAVAAAGAGAGGGGAAVAVAGAPVSPLLGYAPKRRGVEEDQGVGDNKLQDLYIPIGLVVFGLLFAILQMTTFGRVTVDIGTALVAVAIKTVVQVIVIGIALFAAIKAMDIALGSPGPAALKILAVAIAPDAFAQLIASFTGASYGIFIAWALRLILWLVMFNYLFDLDLGEVLMLLGIVVVVQWLLTAFVIFALLNSILPADAVAALGGRGAKAKLNDDVYVTEIIDTRSTMDAKEWVSDGTTRMFGNSGNLTTVQLVDDLRALGCKQIIVAPVKGEGEVGEIYAELPSDKAKRAAIFERYKKFTDLLDLRDKTDEGQDWLIMSFRKDPKKMRAKEKAAETTEGAPETEQDGD